MLFCVFCFCVLCFCGFVFLCVFFFFSFWVTRWPVFISVRLCVSCVPLPFVCVRVRFFFLARLCLLCLSPLYTPVMLPAARLCSFVRVGPPVRLFVRLSSPLFLCVRACSCGSRSCSLADVSRLESGFPSTAVSSPLALTSCQKAGSGTFTARTTLR